MPADGGGVEEDFSALERRKSCAFGIPLIPANQHADLSVLGLPASEARVTRREVEFLVIKRIVRDVHLAVDALERSVRIDDRRRIVVEAARALLKERGDDDRVVLFGDLAEGIGAWAGDGLGELEEAVILHL